MPIIRRNAEIEEQNDNRVVGPTRNINFSDAGGLSQFGAFVQVLPPGSRSSIKHWHAVEDEFVYMLSGEVLLHEGDTTTKLRPGEAACFPAGAALGHCLENISKEDAHYLVVGTRSMETETVIYPDDNRKLTFNRADNTRSWEDHNGAEAGNPYQGA
ncbi:MAG: cupin domain-containing protein [Rhodobacteraceae bacterium]|nr:cupin domain-containing protein [Paracoccaceae bacterium]